jgi:hypothetical protein
LSRRVSSEFIWERLRELISFIAKFTQVQQAMSTEQKSEIPFPRSTVMQKSPQLSKGALTRLLIGMCLLPIITITVLFMILDPAAEGTLDCEFAAVGLPDADFYAIDYWERDEYSGGDLIVSNLEEVDWTHLNIQINGHYQVYDQEPIPAGSSKTFKMERFVTRAGSKFSLRYNELKSARIYARRATRDRAIYYCEFKNGEPVEVER